ncbi:MAG TPA: DUF305 domain-containing protein [Anaeromyxobacter sp.]|nr:DUF305 domain-containing protein [Anaeromyxobacter sp.]
MTTGAAALGAALPLGGAGAQAAREPRDRVILCNEDSNTLSVIDPATNAVSGTINLTSFDEDPRPPFRLVTGGVTPSHAAMVNKPLYRGAIAIHGAAPSPDNRLLACTGRGTSNVYLVDLEALKVVGNAPNPRAGDQTNAERLTSGVLVGREPHEPTFTRNGKELWVTVRGESRIAIVDPAAAREAAGGASSAARRYLECLDGPAQVWFSADGKLAFVVSQKVSRLEVFESEMDAGMARMMRDMHAPGYTGNADVDFLAMMIPHHEGAVEMARLVLVHGRDPLTRRLAEEIIASQTAEIAAMRERLAILRRGADPEPGGFPALQGTRGERP